MTPEEKSLLLKDLSARLAYYPKCKMIDELRVVNNEKDSSYISTLFPKHIELFFYHNNFTIKPYLRPMESMTMVEFKEWLEYCKADYDCEFKPEPTFNLESCHLSINWLNQHHFDYRGLVEKGLAIAVDEKNNPYKE